MWREKLRLEILAALIVLPACGPGGINGGSSTDTDDEEQEETPTEAVEDACSEGDGVRIFDESGQDTGFVRCPDGRVNRVLAVACGPGGECETDADCGPAQMCLCPDGDIFELREFWNTPATCHPAECADGDGCESGECGLGPTDDFSCSSEAALACRSADDSCSADEACIGGDACGIVDGDFACTWFGCIGRPLLDASQTPIVAPTVDRADWCCELGRSSDGAASAEVRGALAEHWERCALGEHASVASFARFAMDLMSLGAPAHLLSRTAKAMADEVEHARLCFGLARRFGAVDGRAARGPGPLAVSSAPMSRDRREVLARLIAEACIGETLAVAEAAAALEACGDPLVAEVLGTIVEDETSHSALAWATLRWAMSTGDPQERQWIAGTLRQAVANQYAAASRDRRSDAAKDAGPCMRMWGRLTPVELADAREEALREVVEPAIRVLLDGAGADSRVRMPRADASHLLA
jgi:hypothetical protein